MELKHCPFCGGNAVYVQAYISETKDSLATWYSVTCENPSCRAEGPYDRTRNGAIKKYNNQQTICPVCPDCKEVMVRANIETEYWIKAWLCGCKVKDVRWY